MAKNISPEAVNHGLKRRLTIVFTLIGGGVLLAGIILSSREIWFQLHAVKTMGHWTDSHGETDQQTGKPRMLYCVRFTTKEGKNVDFFEEVDGEELPEKTPLPVYYDPQNPKDARLMESGRWSLAAQLLSVGALLATSAGAVRFLKKRPYPTIPEDSLPE
jgi:hypothetical protein